MQSLAEGSGVGRDPFCRRRKRGAILVDLEGDGGVVGGGLQHQGEGGLCGQHLVGVGVERHGLRDVQPSSLDDWHARADSRRDVDVGNACAASVINVSGDVEARVGRFILRNGHGRWRDAHP